MLRGIDKQSGEFVESVGCGHYRTYIHTYILLTAVQDYPSEPVPER